MDKLVIPEISEKSNFWMIRAGQAGKYYNDFRINGYVSVDTFDVEKQKIPENTKPDIRKIQEIYRDSILKKLKDSLSTKAQNVQAIAHTLNKAIQSEQLDTEYITDVVNIMAEFAIDIVNKANEIEVEQ